MANPIQGSDLVHSSVEKELKKLETQLISIKEKMEDLNGQSLKIEATLKKQNVATSQGRKEIEKAAKQTDVLSKQQKKLQDTYTETNQKIATLKKLTSDQNRLNKLNAKLALAAKGSYDQLAAQHAINQVKLRAMSKEMRDNSEEGKKLAETNRKIWQEMKRLQKETGPTTLNVGNYKDSIKEAVEELGGMPGAAGKAGGAISGLGQSFKALLANPIVGFIALIVGGLSALGAAFFKTEKGAKVMARITGTLKGLFSAFVGIVDNVATVLSDAFNDPQQAIKDLWTTLKNQLVNRFSGLLDLFKSVGKGLEALWKRDINGLKQASKEAGEAIIQMTTGLDSEQQDKYKRKLEETTKAIIAQADAFAKLETRRRSAAKANRALASSVEKLKTEEVLLNGIASDSTKSIEDQQAAIKKAQGLSEKRAQKEIQIARNNLSLIREEVRLRKANGENVEGLLDEQLDAATRLEEARRELLLIQQGNQQQSAQLTQDELERTLDFLIDGFDVQKTINERKLKDEKLTFAERSKIIEETKKLSDKSFAEQIATVQKAAKAQIDANALINESDAAALDAKVRALGVSDVIAGRLLEIIKERRLANQDLAEAEVELNEARVIAEAKALKDKKKAEKEKIAVELAAFDEQQELEKSKFNLLKKTEKEKEQFQLKLAKARLEKILKIDKTLSDAQVQIIKNQIAEIQQLLGQAGGSAGKDGFFGTGKDLFELLGFELEDKQKAGIVNSFNFAKQELFNYMSARTQLANQRVNIANQEVEAAQRALDAELAALERGEASRVDSARRELAMAQANQDKALKQQEKAQKQERKIQTLQQTGNLITASSKIFGQIGNPLIAIPLIGLMWASFIAAKAKAGQLAKSRFGKGTYQVLEGGSHASGDDIALGFEHQGKPAYAEGGEGMAIFNKSKTRKYGPLLPEIVQAINKGTFEAKFARINKAGDNMPVVISSGVDTSKIEGHLAAIRKQGKTSEKVYDDKGRLVKYRNITYRYAN